MSGAQYFAIFSQYLEEFFNCNNEKFIKGKRFSNFGYNNKITVLFKMKQNDDFNVAYDDECRGSRMQRACVLTLLVYV